MLFPKISEYVNYYSEDSNKATWIYDEYSDELVSFVTEYTKNYNTTAFCRIFNEYSLTDTNMTVGSRNLYVICFLNEGLLLHFLNITTSKYIEHIGSVDVTKLNFIERGRSVGFNLLNKVFTFEIS